MQVERNLTEDYRCLTVQLPMIYRYATEVQPYITDRLPIQNRIGSEILPDVNRHNTDTLSKT